LLETTTMVFEVPTASGAVEKGDRIEYNGQKLRVVDVDEIQLPGIQKIQCSKDTRQP